MEELQIVSDRKVVGLARTSEYKNFFEDKVSSEGLVDFHITVEPNLTEEQELEILKEMVATWGTEKAKKIVEL